MKASKILSIVLGFVLVAAIGCTDEARDFFKTDMTRLLSPDKVIDSPDRSPINYIMPNVSLADQSQELVPNATFPTQDDWVYTDKDYVIGPRDVIDISIMDLFQAGLETILRRQVTESGYIDLPLLTERIMAEGLTKSDLSEAIADAYSPDVLRDPTVSVTLVTRRQNTFSILGAVARPNTYNILRKDMRLMEAIATAGGITQSNIRYIYVIRHTPAVRVRTGRSGDRGDRPETGDGLPPLPRLPEEETTDEALPAPTDGATTAPAEPEGDDIDSALEELESIMPGPAPPTRPEGMPTPSIIPMLSETEGALSTVRTAARPSNEKWIFTDGRWVRVRKDSVEPSTRASDDSAGEVPEDTAFAPDDKRTDAGGEEDSSDTKPAERSAPPPLIEPPVARGRRDAIRPADDGQDPFGWAKVQRKDAARIIAINLSKLRNGDPRMNIIVRDNDIIQVPTLEVGEFYVGGEVLRPGVYSLTGRKVTVKQACIAAGNMGPLAWPENSVLIRRVGNNEEQTIPLDIEAIFQGEASDIYLKPDDVIAVGTNVRAPFYAVLRNAFRMTYGFGFIYDRNFANSLLETGGTPTSDRFTRW